MKGVSVQLSKSDSKDSTLKLIIDKVFEANGIGIGEYKIRYSAYDKNQNYTVVEFTVICK